MVAGTRIAAGPYLVSGPADGSPLPLRNGPRPVRLRRTLFFPARLASYSAASAAAINASAPAAEPGMEAVPMLAVTVTAPGPSPRDDVLGLDPDPNPLRELERAVDSGLRKGNRELLAAIP